MSRFLPILVVLLVAFSLRTFELTEIPPGLTHDEANHGREAMGIIDGILLYYFPLNYGSEPLYSYSVAGSMILLGENLFALRAVNVFFGLATLALGYAWTKRAFGRRAALLAAALAAVSFWPMATSRQALRAGILPFFMVLAVWFFWQMTVVEGTLSPPTTTGKARTRLWPMLGFSLCVAITLHIYLAARVAWLLFPAFLLYLAIAQCAAFRRAWRPTVGGLLLATLLVIPMFVYLESHPGVQTRLDMLDGPLLSLRNAQFAPLIENAGEAVLAFIWPGHGDQFLAYNVPGRPVFDGLSALLMVIGLAIAVTRWRRPSYAFVLLWFLTGILPSLVTGPTANTTRNLAALWPSHLIPVVGFAALTGKLLPGTRSWHPVASIVAVIWLLFSGVMAARDYFVRWGDSPQVRGAYQHTLVEALAFLRRDEGDRPVVISSVYPGPAHDPSIANLILAQSSIETRWVDARWALLVPATPHAQMLVPASTPPHPLFVQAMDLETSVLLRPDDLDPSFSLYALNRAHFEALADDDLVDFGGAVILHHSRWLAPSVRPGETIELLTVWRVINPERAGPLVPPLNTTDIAMFTQVLDEMGTILAQRDSLEAPSWDWRPGDLLVQIHPITIPAEASPGTYPTIVGLYDKLSGDRLNTRLQDGSTGNDYAAVESLHVGN